MCVYIYIFAVSLRPNADHGLSTCLRFLDHNDASQPVGLIWTSDQLVAEISTWQHAQQTDIHAPQRNSNPQYQQAGGLRPTP